MLFSFVFALIVLGVTAQNDPYTGPFEITADNLPSYIGPNPFPFKSYTGYVTVNQENDRHNFYWLTESQGDNPDQDPLVFWYQGGPGCSGLGGLFTEHGPFQPNEDGNIVLTEFPWNKYANVVYLEQPTAVGFSFSGVEGYKYDFDDDLAAQDNFNFLEGFLRDNPKYVGRETWIAGESYAGVYVPTLAAQIVSNPRSQIYKQFAGQMTGNPVFSCDSLKDHSKPLNTFDSQISLFFYRQLTSASVFLDWQNKGCPQHSRSAACIRIFTEALTQVGQIDQELGEFSFNGTQPSMDPDDLYHDFILGNSSLEWVTTLMEEGRVGVDEAAADYLNRADVQQVIHAHAPVSGEWNFCTGKPLDYTPSGESMIPYYQFVMERRPDVHILVYSGETDIATVPAAQTMTCIEEFNGTPLSGREWGPWFVNGATAGYVEQYEEYSYVVIKGSGHEAPTFQPLISSQMFSRFLENQNVDGGEIYFPKNKRRRIARQGDVLRRLMSVLPRED